MPDILIGEITEVHLSVEDGTGNVNMSVFDDTETVNMETQGDVIVRGGSDYNRLRNRPAINEHLLVGGENSLLDIGIGRANNVDINRLFI